MFDYLPLYLLDFCLFLPTIFWILTFCSSKADDDDYSYYSGSEKYSDSYEFETDTEDDEDEDEDEDDFEVNNEIVLVTPSTSKSKSNSKSKSGTRSTKSDDFLVGAPPPHIPIYDASHDDGNSLMDIESIKSEKPATKKPSKIMKTKLDSKKQKIEKPSKIEKAKPIISSKKLK
ncbi:unnamed protein product [Caenorhabditis angaria]|uniref:Uncharacterized protein n=1 Tax=Caenorhabditis angaria TaxID=860376 RepID=A0A9P1IN83_9PELO|nr:unnamed protein product [Caenorhabditis angaria]